MLSVSAAGYRAAGLALSALLVGCAAETPEPAPPPPPILQPRPTRTLPAPPHAAIDLSKAPAHPVPYADLPHPVRPPETAPPTSSTLATGAHRALSSLPGWGAEDHLAALKAFQAGCGVARVAEWRAVCARARSEAASDDAQARAFFEANFTAEAAAPTGVLTAYFAPEYPAEAAPDEVYSAPVRPRPAHPEDAAERPRAEIETDPAEGVQAFMKAEDLFFLQIQGSGVLVFPDGRRMKAIYAADNGLPFTAIARPMQQAGLLAASNLSGDAIRNWLAEHRGPEADAVMDRDARYIFFDLVADDGREPSGAAGQPLTAGRALAIDPAYHKYGALYWIDADAPSLNGAAPAYHRLALALDTGAAIRGERRADLYLGRGDAAGHEAGRVRHVLSLVRLIPNPEPTPAAPHETPAPTGGN